MPRADAEPGIFQKEPPKAERVSGHTVGMGPWAALTCGEEQTASPRALLSAPPQGSKIQSKNKNRNFPGMCADLPVRRAAVSRCKGPDPHSPHRSIKGLVKSPLGSLGARRSRARFSLLLTTNLARGGGETFHVASPQALQMRSIHFLGVGPVRVHVSARGSGRVSP